MLANRFRSGLLVAACVFSVPAVACDDCNKCNGTGECITTVQVPCTVMKTVTETCYRDEERVETVLVDKTITVEKQVPYEYNALVRVKKVDEQEIEIKTPKFRWVDQEYTITVPGKDTVTRVRKRTECVPVECPDGTTEMQEVCVEEPYICEIGIMVPIKKTRKVKEYFTKTEKKTVKHPYTTLEYRKRSKTVTAFVPETVKVEQQRVCTVKVPYTVEKLVPVTVMQSQQQTTPCDCGCSS
ncbi:hypothetical protein NHH03_19750 [Stieleria sp. TO1_6]|uniref:hypothetical protein n=1 Tax=Stieleria tagensis TaxID=2956795 RepID=UPI00209B2A4C|nr:hypothetical protein [Stieleria tagensis]MCO8123988.1 hypothetical protein [Stieleria tagensis]